MKKVPDRNDIWNSPKNPPPAYQEVWILFEGDTYSGYRNHFKLYRIRGLRNGIQYVAEIDGWLPMEDEED